jgi:hypothetical protein
MRDSVCVTLIFVGVVGSVLAAAVGPAWVAVACAWVALAAWMAGDS